MGALGVEEGVNGHAAALRDYEGLPLDHLGEVEATGIAECTRESKIGT